MINFSQAFDLAWERMEVILFRTFDLAKWFVIGFSAFLAGFLYGGNGFNSLGAPSLPSHNDSRFTSYAPSHPGHDFVLLNGWFSHHSDQAQFQNYGYHYQYHYSLPGMVGAGFSATFMIIFYVLVIGFSLLIGWLGARGQFLLLDNVVRNRGAIAWPWRAYARLGNGLFLFNLLIGIAFFVVTIPLDVVGFYIFSPLSQQHRWPEGNEVPLVALFSIVCLVVFAGWLILMYLFLELGVPLMFRHGLTARAAFGATLKLIRDHTWMIFLFVLLRIALAFAFWIVSITMCCATCCVGGLPYLGTVALLPALLFLKCFSLNFLAQFGPEYDVWTVDVAATTTALS